MFVVDLFSPVMLTGTKRVYLQHLMHPIPTHHLASQEGKVKGQVRDSSLMRMSEPIIKMMIVTLPKIISFIES